MNEQNNIYSNQLQQPMMPPSSIMQNGVKRKKYGVQREKISFQSG